jgi:hypothetical protein
MMAEAGKDLKTSTAEKAKAEIEFSTRKKCGECEF